MPPTLDTDHMRRALALARAAAARGEVPVGALLVRGEECLGEGATRPIADHDPTAHAEMLVIREACRLLATRHLEDCTLLVTLEPCPMCAQAISFARLGRLVFGAYDPKGGGVEHGPRVFSQPSCHHRPEVIGGLRETECATQLQRFFQARRRGFSV